MLPSSARVTLLPPATDLSVVTPPVLDFIRLVPEPLLITWVYAAALAILTFTVYCESATVTVYVSSATVTE